MHIQELARRIGVSERTIRHYERAGLLRPAREQNGYRTFADEDVARASLIRDMIQSGFSTRELRMFSDCFDVDARGEPASRPDECARRLRLKLGQIERTIALLEQRRHIVLTRLQQASTQMRTARTKARSSCDAAAPSNSPSAR